MSTITNTTIEVVSTGQDFNIPGDWTASELVNMFSDQVQGLGNMDAEETVDGSTRDVVFRPRTGNKGADSIQNTTIEVVSTGQDFNIPGDWTADEVVNMFSDQVQGLANMDSEETIDGTTRNIVFRPRTGNKG